MDYLAIPVFILMIPMFLWNYYLYRIKFIHEFQSRKGWWWLNGIATKGREEEILATRNNSLIKDYYMLRKFGKICKVLALLIGLSILLIILSI